MDLNSIQVFSQVVEQGSFTAAAKILGLTKATVSRKVADLEADAGVQLLFRTTRALKLTEAGASYYHRINQILIELKQASDLLSANQEKVKGKLRIVCPIELGQLFMGPVFAGFLKEYPEITIDAELSNRRVSPIEEGVDMLLQITGNQDPRLQSHKLLNTEKILIASPSYIERYGMPRSPEDLRQHQAIKLASAHVEHEWIIFDGKQWHDFAPEGALTVNNITLAREAAIEGLGIALANKYISQEAIDQQRLIPILEDFPMQQTQISLSYPLRTYLPRKYRVFIQFLYQHLYAHWGDKVLEIPNFVSLQKPSSEPKDPQS